MIDDATLLRRYATEGSQEAFSEFVQRYLPLVYSAALRRLGGDAHRAEDVAQSVFCAVARDAHRLSQHPVVTGWLYTATRFAVTDVVRAENRRRTREEEAHHMMYDTSPDLETAADWSRLSPVLDAAMDDLTSADREAVLLRFFQGRAFAEIGAALGLTEDTARKRVERALDKLGSLLRRRGIASTSAALAAVLASESMAATPAGLASTITGAALAGGGATASVATVMTVTKLHVGLAAAAIAAGASGLIWQQHTLGQLRAENAALQNQLTAQAPLTVQARLAAQTTAGQAEATASSAPGVAGKTSAPAPEVSRKPSPSMAAKASSTVADTPSNRRRRQSWHHRFDPFFATRSYTPAQVERLADIYLIQEDIRGDVQESMRANGVPDSRGVRDLIGKLQAPMKAELHDILLPEDRAAYDVYSNYSYFKVSFVEPLLPKFNAARAPLTEAQTDRLIALVDQNNRPVKPSPIELSSTSRIDWDGVASQTSTFLTPAQQAVLEKYALDEKARYERRAAAK